jgi:hypothetical protein
MATINRGGVISFDRHPGLPQVINFLNRKAKYTRNETSPMIAMILK